MSSGTPAPTASNSVPLDQVQDLALKITTYFEGGKSMNYQALSDDFDGMGTSFGLIQWNFGQGTLGPLLTKMMAANEAAFAGCFGANAEHDTLKAAISAGSIANQLSWARGLLKANRPAWKTAFNSLGANDAFNQIQRQQAIAHYHPRTVTVVADLRGISPTLFSNVEVRSYLAIFDLCVQQNGIDNVLTEIKARVAAEQPASQLDLMKIAVVERARAARPQYIADCESRRMGILTGAAYTASEHGVTATRQNPEFSLIGNLGTQFVAGL